jgi:hypothetical protein
MHRIIVSISVAVLIMLGTPEASRAHSPQWWYVAEEADRVLFVDTGSIQREGDEIRYNSSLIVRDPADDLGERRAFMQADCNTRKMQWPMVVRYGLDGERLDETVATYPAATAVEPGTLAATELDFVCASNHSDGKSNAFPIAVDMAVFAEALIANTDTGIRPSEIHDYLRRGSKTPLIRSTAPPPETFGTEQQVAVGRPIVPPRDYSRTVEIPPLNEYDSDEVGRIYDIAYQGIEGGELVFEIRGYASDDLAHSGSGQNLRFPHGAHEVQLRGLVIAIIEATPDNLRYRVDRRIDDAGNRTQEWNSDGGSNNASASIDACH